MRQQSAEETASDNKKEKETQQRWREPQEPRERQDLSGLLRVHRVGGRSAGGSGLPGRSLKGVPSLSSWSLGSLSKGSRRNEQAVTALTWPPCRRLLCAAGLCSRHRKRLLILGAGSTHRCWVWAPEVPAGVARGRWKHLPSIFPKHPAHGVCAEVAPSQDQF